MCLWKVCNSLYLQLSLTETVIEMKHKEGSSSRVDEDLSVILQSQISERSGFPAETKVTRLSNNFRILFCFSKF
jgi:hypothetical protein